MRMLSNALRCQRGFTLVELAIVLVIIGIILGAVLKGQDLIENANAKKIASIPSQWEVPMWAYYDRNGSFPGDSAKDGAIDSHAALETALDGAGLGHPQTTTNGVTVSISSINACGVANRNVMLLANVPLMAAKQLDNNFDGTEDATKGRIRNCGNAGTTASAAWGTTDPTSVTYFFDKTIP
ncbi:MAG: prepilin-type N-terminal cleavage/methylation domain-containing protein [Dissulfurispiraceae bacterium]|nr:prepilin-type N-terminal cleavage/methylation domain-containing protein [Dissulfurispiraceae bacterium]